MGTSAERHVLAGRNLESFVLATDMRVSGRNVLYTIGAHGLVIHIAAHGNERPDVPAPRLVWPPAGSRSLHQPDTGPRAVCEVGDQVGLERVMNLG